jgi:predicted RNase H-like HicB family nuclease
MKDFTQAAKEYADLVGGAYYGGTYRDFKTGATHGYSEAMKEQEELIFLLREALADSNNIDNVRKYIETYLWDHDNS